MNLKNFKDTKSFILDIPKDMKLDFFWCWLLAFVVSFFHWNLFLPLLELIGILLHFHFFFFYITFLKVFLDDPQSMVFLVLPFSIIGLLFYAFLLSLILSVSLSFLITYLSLPPVWGVILVKVSFWKKIFYQAQNGTARDNISRNVKG